MSDSGRQVVVVTFRIPEDVADRVLKAKSSFPPLPGTEISLNQACRAFMFKGLEAHEKEEE